MVEGSCQATNVGLWVDAFNFAVITIQIVVMDTRYTDIISDDLRKKEKNAMRYVVWMVLGKAWEGKGWVKDKLINCGVHSV